MPISNLTYYRQIEDYVDALRAYLIAATGLPAERVVFAPPNIAKRKLKEVTAQTQGYPNTNTRELDKFLSFHFPFTTPNIAYSRQNPMTAFSGSVAEASRTRAFQDQYDLPIQVDVWGGPTQDGKVFTFNTSKSLQFYMGRHQRIQVQFRDLVTKNPLKPFEPFDVGCFYEILRWTATDNSHIEGLFTAGAIYRVTFEFNWMISLYRATAEPVGRAMNIILEIQNDVTKEFEKEWETNGYTTTTTTTSI